MLNFDVARVWTKWLADFRDAQAPSGEIPEIVPSTPQYGYENTPGWSVINGPTPSWDAAAFVLPDELYQQTGDMRLLADMYRTQQRLLDYTATWFTPGDVHYRQTANTILGEYGLPRPPLTAEMLPASAAPAVSSTKPSPGPGAVDAVATAYFYFMTDRMAHNARVLGHRDEARSYAARADVIRQAYNRTYWDAARRRYRVPEQASGGAMTQGPFVQYQNVLPVVFGLVPRGAAADVVRQLNDDIVAHDYHLSSTGVFAGRYVLQLLSDFGYGNTAYRLVTQTTEPSWGFWIRNDIHTMLEGWELDSRSYDHHYWASVSSWFFQGLAGIRPAMPGYSAIAIMPVTPDGLASASAEIDTVRGKIRSAWQRDGNRILMTVSLPAGTNALVRCPPRQTARSSLNHPRARQAIYHLGSGSRRLVCVSQ